MEEVLFVTILVGLIELVKKTTQVNIRWIPLIGFFLTAIIFAVFVYLNNVEITWDIVSRTIIMALAPLGLYSGVKTTTQ